MTSEESTSLLEEHDEPLITSKVKQIYDQIQKRRKENDETLNEQEFDKYLQEELDTKFPQKYLKVLQQNLIFYAFILICVGLPLWWITTSPYRAALQSIDPSIDNVKIPVNITFFYESSISRSSFQNIAIDLADNNPEMRINAEFISFSKGVDENLLRTYALNVVLLTSNSFNQKFPNLTKSTKIQGNFIKENTLMVNFVNMDSLFSLLSRVLGTERLKSISNLKLQANLTAWDRIPISTLYHLHLVFLHDNGAQNSDLQSKILNDAKKISNLASKYGVLVDVSSVHLWDFDVESFVTTAKSSERRMLIKNVELLTTEVDKYVNWIGIGIAQPLIKMAIFVSDQKIKMLDSNGKDSNGFTAASWGGICAFNLNDPTSASPVLHSILDTLKTQLNVRPIEPEWNVEFDHLSPTHEFEWQRFRMQAFREHILIASSSLRSIHALRQKIENLVISKQVSVDIYEAHEILMATLLQARVHSRIDMHGAIRARILAERAVKHSSTLQHLNFPMEQRYAIYVPFFLPVFVHILTATWHMLRVIPAAFKRNFKSIDGNIEYFPYLSADTTSQ